MPMIKLDSAVVAEHYIKDLDKRCRASCMKVLGEVSPMYLYGFAQSDIQFLLTDLDLTQKQLKVITDRYSL